jgi:flagellar biosynthetic protein FliO
MEVLQQISAVAGVLLLLGATLWWLRRRGVATVGLRRGGSTRRMECLERVALGPQQTLHLVRVGDRTLLVAASAAGCSLLHSVPCDQLDRRPREAQA